MDRSEDSGENVRARLRFLKPDLLVGGLADVRLETLRTWGIRGVIIDLDNTLVRYDNRTLAPEIRAWVEAALTARFRLVLLSNESSATCVQTRSKRAFKLMRSFAAICASKPTVRRSFAGTNCSVAEL